MVYSVAGPVPKASAAPFSQFNIVSLLMSSTTVGARRGMQCCPTNAHQKVVDHAVHWSASVSSHSFESSITRKMLHSPKTWSPTTREGFPTDTVLEACSARNLCAQVFRRHQSDQVAKLANTATFHCFMLRCIMLRPHLATPRHGLARCTCVARLSSLSTS